MVNMASKGRFLCPIRTIIQKNQACAVIWHRYDLSLQRKNQSLSI